MATSTSRWPLSRTVAVCGALLVASVFLWTQHRSHVTAALPYLVLLACPLFHLLMHRGHHRDQEDSEPSSPAHQHHH